MKKTYLICMLAAMSILIAGCGRDSENEALRKQVSDLEQQVADLENNQANTASPETQAPAQNGSYTIEELSGMVDSYVGKADEIIANGQNSDIEQYFELRQEHNSIEHGLELLENELEAGFHNKTLTREEYAKQEFELESLEERLDSANEQLEHIFGIDD